MDSALSVSRARESARRPTLTVTTVVLVLAAFSQLLSAQRVQGQDDASPAHADGTLLALDHMPSDAAVYFSVLPVELFNRRELKALEELLDIGEPYRHPVPITQIKQLTFAAERREEGVMNNSSSLMFDLNIVTTTSAVDWDEVVADSEVRYERVDVGETYFLRLEGQQNICVWPVDERTYIAGPEDSIRRAISRHEAGETHIPMETGLAVFDGAQMGVGLSCDYVSETIDKFLAESQGSQGGLDLVLSGTKSSLKDAQCFVLSMVNQPDRELPVTIRVGLGCDDGQTVVEKEKSLGFLLFVFRQYALGQKRRREQSGAALRRPILADMGEEMFANTAYRRTDQCAILDMHMDAKVGNAVGFLISIVGTLGGVPGTARYSNAFDETVVAERAAMTTSLPPGILDSPRLAERRQASIGNLQAVADAVAKYAEVQDRLPAWSNFAEDGTPLLSWRVHLLPYLGYEELHARFHLDEPWNSEHNQALLAEVPKEYAGPRRGDGASGHTDRAAVFVVVGKQTPFPQDGSVPDQAIVDLEKFTAFLVEARRDVPWTKPDDFTLNEQGQLDDQVFGLHPGGLVIVDGEGAAHFVADSSAAQVLAGRDAKGE